nr:immunoglobulin light chain junction region [Macaca mulatta]MOX19333.1 immunoglobulin light chain junction region [Macaca mulatta]
DYYCAAWDDSLGVLLF